MKQFLSFIKKEFLHILRDKRTILILLAMPVVQIILFGFAISTEVKNIRVAVLDMSQCPQTADLVRQVDASEYFSVQYAVDSIEQANTLFLRSKIDVALVFDRNYASEPRVQLIADASDPNTATISTNYLSSIINSLSAEQQMPLVDQKLIMLYNPSMLSSYNFVPGVMGMILMLICAMMTSISIVREKEVGTMEVLLVSPVHPIKIIVAKLVPYFVISVINLTVILLLSVYVLGVPVVGSLGWLMLLSMLFILVALSLGLFISTIVASQVAAMIISGMVLMMPTVLLSGMMFPIENMPLPLQWFSSLMPARWFISGVRKLMIQGVEVQYAAKEFIILGAMAFVLIGVSLKKFKIRL